MRKVIRGNKMRTLASKTFRIQKTLRKIVIDNNQKVTWFFFITSFESYIRVKLKLQSFINRANFLTLCYYYGEIDENSSAPSHFSCVYRSQTKRRLVIQYEYFFTHFFAMLKGTKKLSSCF